MPIVNFLRPASFEGCDYAAGQKIDFGDGDRYRDKIAEWQELGPIVELTDGSGIVTAHNPQPPYGEVPVEPPAEPPVEQYNEPISEISSTEPTDG